MTKMKKVLVIGLPILAVLIVAGVTFASRTRGVEGVEVQIEPVGRRQVVQTVTAPARSSP